MPPKKKAPTWFKSKAKQIMAQDMIDGLVPTKEPIKDAFRLYTEYYLPREEFKYFPWHPKNVPDRIEHLWKSIANLGDSLQLDKDALAHDRQLHPDKPTEGYNGRLLWEGSNADRLLKIDMAAGLHLQFSPKDLRATRPEYGEFSQTRFTKRIDQLKERAKKYGKTPGQNRTSKLPTGLPEESRKDDMNAYNNDY